MIIEQNVKKIVVPIIFSRTALDTRRMVNISAFFTENVTFEVWPQFPDLSVTLMLGHGQGDERMLRVYLNQVIHTERPFVATQEIDFHTPVNGLTITRSAEKHISRTKALELIKSGKARYFDNENLELSILNH